MNIRDRIPGLKTSTGSTQTRRRPKKKPAARPARASRASSSRKNLKQRAKRKPGAGTETRPQKWFAFLRGLFK
jgi:hypothetical protein